MTFVAYRMKDIDLILGDEATGPNFKCQVQSALVTAEVNDDEVKTACPEGTYRDVDAPSYSLELGYVYGKADGDDQALWRYLFDHHGEKQSFLFRPWSGDDYGGMSGTVTLSTGGMGGEVGSWSEQSVTLPIEGKPSMLDAVAATGATAGTPGSFTPAGATPPEAGDLTSVTASPASAWTTGQYVTISGGVQAYWDGDSWVTGSAAP